MSEIKAEIPGDAAPAVDPFDELSDEAMDRPRQAGKHYSVASSTGKG